MKCDISKDPKVGSVHRFYGQAARCACGAKTLQRDRLVPPPEPLATKETNP